MDILSRRTLFLISTRRIPISSTINIQIAHFSTNQSPSYYPSRRHDEEARNVKVSVWWDVESCSLPADCSAYRVVHSITAALRANGIKGPLRISAFGNVLKLPKLTQEVISSTGITLTHVLSGSDVAGRKNKVSSSIITELMYWVFQHPPPAHLFLISGDHDMASTLHRLRMNNYNILLAGPEDASAALCSASSIMWQWSNLVKGENLTGKHFNHPPDGPSGSWYGTFRAPLESPFPAVEQLMPSRDGEAVESESENTIRDIPTEVAEQICQILIAYPKGISIRSLREELNKAMMVDQNLYGYKKFSSLLLAMPHILELRHRKDGQHLVCAIDPKVHLSAGSPMEVSKKSVVGICNNKTPPPTEKSADEICNLESHLITNEKSKPIQIERTAPAIPIKQPSTGRECQGPPISEKDVDVKCNPGSANNKMKDTTSEDGILRRTWTKWFGGSSDVTVMSEGDQSIQNAPSLNSSHNGPATEEKSEMSEKIDSEIGRIQMFYSRVLNWFETGRSKIESAAAGSVSSNASSEVGQDKPVEPDLQKQMEGALELTNQSPAPIASMKLTEVRKARMLADCQKLLDAIVKSHPSGFNLAGFRKLFFERYCYCLDVKYLEFEKLTSLINTMSGVKVKGTIIFPTENSSSNGSLDTFLQDNINRTNAHIDSDSEMSAPSTNSYSSDSRFDEQLGPIISLNSNVPSGRIADLKLKTEKKIHHLYKPCAEEDIYTDSDGETPGKGKPKVHGEVSSLMDILSNWEASKDGASKSNRSEIPVKNNLQNSFKPHSPVEVSRKSSRSIVQKGKPQRTINFISADNKKEVDFRSTA